MLLALAEGSRAFLQILIIDLGQRPAVQLVCPKDVRKSEEAHAKHTHDKTYENSTRKNTRNTRDNTHPKNTRKQRKMTNHHGLHRSMWTTHQNVPTHCNHKQSLSKQMGRQGTGTYSSHHKLTQSGLSHFSINPNTKNFGLLGLCALRLTGRLQLSSG